MPPNNNNNNYRQAGDWRYDRDSRYTADGYRRSDGRKKIMGYSSKQWEPRASGIDEFDYRQDGYSPEQAKTLARQLAQRGYRKGFGGQGIEPNRSLSSRERRQLGLDKEQSSAPTGPTDDQRKWAKAFRESSTRPPLRSAAATPSADDTPGAASASARSGFLSKYGMKPQEADSRPPLRAAAGPLNLSPTTSAAPKEPLNFSRSALVEGAKQTGDFKKIREGFNTQSKQAGTGMRMNDLGVATPISKTKVGADGLTPFARERFGPAMEEKAAARDFARGEAPVQFNRAPEGAFAGQESLRSQTVRPIVSATKVNPYGTATATFGPRAHGAGGTMPDPLTGKKVPMKNALAEQSAVQDTKFGPNAEKAGEGYFDPKAIRQSVQKGRRV